MSVDSNLSSKENLLFCTICHPTKPPTMMYMGIHSPQFVIQQWPIMYTDIHSFSIICHPTMAHHVYEYSFSTIAPLLNIYLLPHNFCME
jgi:hypothetical protein